MASSRSPGRGRSRSRRTEAKADSRRPAAEDVEASQEDSLQLQDPRAIRALAHPARMAVINALASGDELTATECAALTGLSPSATAYHLNLLARYGFAEPAPARNDGRQRPWRATNRRSPVEIDTSTPAGAAAAAAVGLAYFDSTRAVAQEWVTSADDEPREWQDVALLSNADLWLTVEETQTLAAALTATLAPYRGRTLADCPDGSRRVRVMNTVVPRHGR